jgi:hypothetical protein
MDTNKKGAGPLLFSIIAVAAFILILAIEPTRELFKAATAAHPFLMGFVKFALLATVGELLAIRLMQKAVAYIVQLGLIPGTSGRLLPAFLCSLIMNVTFAPTMMIFHKITDTAITMKYNRERLVSLKNVVGNIDLKR